MAKRTALGKRARAEQAMHYNKNIIPKQILGCNLRTSEIDDRMDCVQHQYVKIEKNDIVAVCYLYFFLDDRDWMATYDEGPDCLTGTAEQLVTSLAGLCHQAVDELIETKSILDARARGEDIPLTHDEIVAAFLAF